MATQSSRVPVSRAQEIMEMFAGIPVSKLREKTLQLLDAKRHVSQGRDLPMILEDDNAIQVKVYLAIVEQSAGAPGTRRAIEPPLPPSEEKPGPGLLVKRRNLPAVDSAPHSLAV